MSAQSSDLELYNTLESLKNTISKNRFNLIELSLAHIVVSAQRYLSLSALNEIFLEFLIKLSEAIYLKSCLLLNINIDNGEKIIENEEKNGIEEKTKMERLSYHKVLSLERILFDKIFLSGIFEYIETLNKEENLGEAKKQLILKAILSVISKELTKERMIKNFSLPSIEFYLSDLRKYFEKKISFSFFELIEEKLGVEKENKFLEVIYYFLSLLFLCFEDYCYMIQNSEDEDIVIFLKSSYSEKKA